MKSSNNKKKVDLNGVLYRKYNGAAFPCFGPRFEAGVRFIMRSHAKSAQRAIELSRTRGRVRVKV